MPQRKRDRDGLYRRADSPYYWASYVDVDGRRVRRSAGTADREEAEALLAKWRLESFRLRRWGAEPDRSFEDVMVQYLREAAGRPSLETIRIHVRQLRESFARRSMQSLKGADIMAHVARRRSEGVSDSTINRELEVLSAAINHVRHALEWDIPNPVPGRKLRKAPPRVRWLTREEADRLIAAARGTRSPWLASLILLALHTGMRRGEMLGLEWARVDLKQGLVHLYDVHTKTARHRSVPLNRSAREALLAQARFRAAHCPDSPWVFCKPDGSRIRDVHKGFRTARRKAGIEDFRFHDLRHTCAAWLVSTGVPLSEVRDLLGHTNVTMTERYAHLAPERVREAVQRLDRPWSRFGHAGDRTGSDDIAN